MGNEAVSRFEIKFDREWSDMCLLYGKKHKERFPRKNESCGVLSEFEEELLIAMYNEGIPYKEIGDRLGVGFELVANRIQRMLKSGTIEKKRG